MIWRSAASVILGVLIAAGFAYAKEVPVVTVCDALSNRTFYNGKSIIIVGEFWSWMEGSALDSTCSSELVIQGHKWSNSIWLGNDETREAPPPSHRPNYRKYEARILATLPKRDMTKLKVIADCGYSGVSAAVFGRFETKDSYPVIHQTMQIGFGHLGMYPAQLVWPKGGFWCLVPPDKLPALLELDRVDREKRRIALWRNIKAELQSSGGRAFFDAHMKGFLLPPLRGTVISTDVPARPSRIILAISDAITAEAALNLDQRLKGSLLPGTEIEFEGVAVALTQEPFMMKLDVARSKLKVRASPSHK